MALRSPSSRQTHSPQKRKNTKPRTNANKLLYQITTSTTMNDNPPILGIIALYAFGVATGFGIAALFYAFA
jgi:hypothetical protein